MPVHQPIDPGAREQFCAQCGHAFPCVYVRAESEFRAAYHRALARF